MAKHRANSPDRLPSWNDSAAKQAILDFVIRVTKKGGPDFVPEADRIATFDNDGTLWCEQPFYFQGLFAFERIKALVPQHPEWRERQPFKAVLDNDMKALTALGEKSLLELVMVSHAGNTTEEFQAIVQDWLDNAKHPRFQRPYHELVYQPMVELLAYLRANGSKTFIVSGGGIEFMRLWAEEAYGIPPEQVIGSSIVTKFEMRGGKPVLVRLPQLSFLDDKAGKPVAINQHIGRRPIAAFGNSIGDQQMLEYTGAGDGARLMMLVLHDDDKREYAYGPKTKVGTFTEALMAEAKKQNWTVISMKNDWKNIFSFDK